jgi:hypothetical protein
VALRIPPGEPRLGCAYRFREDRSEHGVVRTLVRVVRRRKEAEPVFAGIALLYPTELATQGRSSDTEIHPAKVTANTERLRRCLLFITLLPSSREHLVCDSRVLFDVHEHVHPLRVRVQKDEDEHAVDEHEQAGQCAAQEGCRTEVGGGVPE